MKIPSDHPRKNSLKQRKKVVNSLEKGIISEHGLIAHGRGEAFDYLIGEKTTEEAKKATKAAVKLIKTSKNPILSINGNTAALVPEDISNLVKNTNLEAEINLFHRTQKRIEKIIDHLKKHGLSKVYGKNPEKKIPGLDHERAKVTEKGIYSADTVIVPLEDGDRTEKLKEMNKNVIAIDLNPLSRTSQKADITIVDNITRAIKNINKYYQKINKSEIKDQKSFNNQKNLKKMERKIRSGFGEEKNP
ncbi:phosphopantothenate/pantothenate synthetase [archaeon SCG-AAA382B04]|nr:phosphopantothenate/pantothenate synthetase [archaeon SCG-AAA382B04]